MDITKDITKISFALSVAGIVALFFVTEGIRPLEINVSSINNEHLGRNVAVNGTIKSITNSEGNIFITLAERDFRIVVFRNKADDEDYALKRSDKISATGKVQLYKNGLEIIADKIEKI